MRRTGAGTLRQVLKRAKQELKLSDRDRASYRIPKVDTRLTACYQPSTNREVGEVDPEPLNREQHTPMVGFGAALAPPAPVGLSEDSNSDQPSERYGRKGLTKNGARNIQRATAFLQEDKAKLSFWTVTLPDGVADHLQDTDRWALFQDSIRRYLKQALERAGLEAWIIGVVELHPRRSMRQGRPVPHIHCVFKNKGKRGRGWVIRTGQLDRIIQMAAKSCGLEEVDTKAAGNVQPVRKNCGAYMAKYMTKNSNLTNRLASSQNLPKQWWFWTKALRTAVLELVVSLAWGLVQILHRMTPEELTAQGVHRERLELDDDRAPVTFVLSWISPAAMDETVSLWLASRFEAECR